MFEENEYNHNGKLTKTESFKYKYDNRGNWIEKIEYNDENIPKTITERKIECY